MGRSLRSPALLLLALTAPACSAPDLAGRHWTCGSSADCPSGERCSPGDCPAIVEQCAPTWCATADQCTRGYCRTAMVSVPAGEFWKGCDDSCDPADQTDFPGGRVQLPAFAIDTTEVTLGAWLQAGFARPDCDATGWYPDVVTDTELPVVCVPQPEAARYCTHRDERLCTADEWEKAARGTDPRRYPWGNEPPDPTRANCSPDADQPAGDSSCRGPFFERQLTRAPVGSFPRGASPYGALDLAGNVVEWTATDHPAFPGEVMVRGGGYPFGEPLLRSYERGEHVPPTGDGSRNEWLGFRCCR